jgi:hypothetical protein
MAQARNCAVLPYLSTCADIFKRVNHRNLRCSALRGLHCKTVSGTLRGAGESRHRTVLPCPTTQLALTYSNVSQKHALLCPASQCVPYLIISSSTVSVIALIPAPGFTKLDTATIVPKLRWSLVAQFLAWLSPIITFHLTSFALFTLCIIFWHFILWLLDERIRFTEDNTLGTQSLLRLDRGSNWFKVCGDSC